MIIKRYLRWVNQKWEGYNNKHPKTVIELKQPENNKTPTDTIGCFSAFGGCLFAIFQICIIFMIVSWAWHIHWFFGILMFFFISSLYGRT